MVLPQLKAFTETGLEPHGFCLQWDPWLVGLHAVSDTVIGLSYYVIPVALIYFSRKRRDVAFGWVLWMFGAFILACGTSHFLEIWVLWHPDYRLQGAVKGLTAALSLTTAIMVWPLLPRALQLPSPAQFRRSEDRYRLLVEGVVDYAIFMIDTEGKVTNWNQGAERLFGYSAEEIVNGSFAQFFTAEAVAAGFPARALATALGEGRYEVEIEHVRKSGIRFWANMVLDPVRDAAGRLRGFAAITRDVTERHQQEATLEETRAALAQAQKMEAVGQLTGGVAHDFNNLLTAILGNIELLEERSLADRPDLARLLRSAKAAAERGAKLTQRLLAFSRRQMLQPRPADLNQLVAGMSDLLHHTLGEIIRIETTLAPDLWRSFVDPNQMESALLNLAVNARDAMPDGGTLTIETGNTCVDTDVAASRGWVTPGHYVTVTVTDTGIGMSDDVISRAFEPFFTTKTEGQGTGLGLSQVYGFVTQSGGHVTIKSHPGQGTKVRIYLPPCHAGQEEAGKIEAGEIEAGEPAEPPGAAVPNGSGTILVAEDDADVRTFSTEALTRLGYQVLEAADAATALRLLAGHPEIQLLFTDIVLPDMNGRLLAEKARAHDPRLKILFTTGYDRAAAGEQSSGHRGVHLLTKPFTAGSLARKLEQVMQEEVT